MTKLPTSDLELLLNVGTRYKTQKAFAESLGISPRTLRRWKQQNRIPERRLPTLVPKLKRRERYYHKREVRRVRELPRYTDITDLNLNRYIPRRLFAFGMDDAIRAFPELSVRIEQAINRGATVSFTVHIYKAGKLLSVQTVTITAGNMKEFIRELYRELVMLYGMNGGKGSGLTLILETE